MQQTDADEVGRNKIEDGDRDGIDWAAKINESDYLRLGEAFYGALQKRDSDALEIFLQDLGDPQSVLEERTIRFAIQLVAVGATLMSFLPDTGQATSADAPARSTQQG